MYIFRKLVQLTLIAIALLALGCTRDSREFVAAGRSHKVSRCVVKLGHMIHRIARINKLFPISENTRHRVTFTKNNRRLSPLLAHFDVFVFFYFRESTQRLCRAACIKSICEYFES